MVAVADELVLLRGIDLVGGADGCALEGYAEAAGLLGLGVALGDDLRAGPHTLQRNTFCHKLNNLNNNMNYIVFISFSFNM